MGYRFEPYLDLDLSPEIDRPAPPRARRQEPYLKLDLGIDLHEGEEASQPVPQPPVRRRRQKKDYLHDPRLRPGVPISQMPIIPEIEAHFRKLSLIALLVAAGICLWCWIPALVDHPVVEGINGTAQTFPHLYHDTECEDFLPDKMDGFNNAMTPDQRHVATGDYARLFSQRTGVAMTDIDLTAFEHRITKLCTPPPGEDPPFLDLDEAASIAFYDLYGNQ